MTAVVLSAGAAVMVWFMGRDIRRRQQCVDLVAETEAHLARVAE